MVGEIVLSLRKFDINTETQDIHDMTGMIRKVVTARNVVLTCSMGQEGIADIGGFGDALRDDDLEVVVRRRPKPMPPQIEQLVATQYEPKTQLAEIGSW